MVAEDEAIFEKLASQQPEAAKKQNPAEKSNLQILYGSEKGSNKSLTDECTKLRNFAWE